MPDIATAADALQWFYTGAASDGAAISDIHGSIGGYRSSERLDALAIEVSGGPSGLRYSHPSGENGVGDGVLDCPTANTVRWQPPGGSFGDAVTIANGETKQVCGADVNQYLLVERVNAEPLGQAAVLSLLDRLNVHRENAATAEQAAGSARCRAFAVRNAHASETLTDIRVWLATLAGPNACGAAGYAASGAVSVPAAGGETFDGWSQSGLVANVTSGEVLYYSSRTVSALTVPAAGRDVYSEVAGGAAGTASDVLREIPPIRLGVEAPSAQPGGTFTLLSADTDAAPVSLSRPLTEADAVVIANLAPGNIYAVWAQWTLLAGATAMPYVLDALELSFEGEPS